MVVRSTRWSFLNKIILQSKCFEAVILLAWLFFKEKLPVYIFFVVITCKIRNHVHLKFLHKVIIHWSHNSEYLLYIRISGPVILNIVFWWSLCRFFSSRFRVNGSCSLCHIMLSGQEWVLFLTLSNKVFISKWISCSFSTRRCNRLLLFLFCIVQNRSRRLSLSLLLYSFFWNKLMLLLAFLNGGL